MFGISLAKLLLLAAVLAAVWYGFKYLQARDRQAKAVRRDAAARVAPGDAAARVGTAEDLIQCPVCATYVARGARGCGRADCPQGRG